MPLSLGGEQLGMDLTEYAHLHWRSSMACLNDIAYLCLHSGPMCAIWQWNARDCALGLHNRRTWNRGLTRDLYSVENVVITTNLQPDRYCDCVIIIYVKYCAPSWISIPCDERVTHELICENRNPSRTLFAPINLRWWHAVISALSFQIPVLELELIILYALWQHFQNTIKHLIIYLSYPCAVIARCWKNIFLSQ